MESVATPRVYLQKIRAGAILWCQIEWGWEALARLPAPIPEHSGWNHVRSWRQDYHAPVAGVAGGKPLPPR
jgi:hypothetical protein